MLPNILTVIRIVLTVFFIHFLLEPQVGAKVIALSIFFIASITDFLDGYLARKYQLISSFGKIADPIADKFLVLAAFFVFARLDIVAWWMIVVIAAREIIITVLRFVAMAKKQVLAAEQLGKIKTVAQIVAISVILILILCAEMGKLNLADVLWNSLVQVLMVIVVVLTLISGFQNIWNNRRVYFVRKNG